MYEAEVHRPAESRAVEVFLEAARQQPSCLVVEGEAGIGKTTLWLTAIGEARKCGFTLLSAQTGQAESILSNATTADLLRDVDSAVLEQLPEVQQLALDRVMLRTDPSGVPTDHRVVATAFLSILERLAIATPVLVAIDDVQWLDPSSKALIAFVARRLKGPIGVLLTERVKSSGETTMSWFRLTQPDGIERRRLHPMSLGGLAELFKQKLGRTFPRATMTRLAEISGGNPYFALELARATDNESPGRVAELPSTLAEVVQTRIEQLTGDARDMLLAAACAAEPTVDLLVRATANSVERTAALLEESERYEIIRLDGNRVRFTHPLLAAGVYTNADRPRRRAIHRALAEIEELPELKGRHLALAATSSEPTTLETLDEAANAARARGAPVAAAELTESAIRLGGDTPLRRLRAAEDYLLAGDYARARDLVEQTIDQLPASPQRATALQLSAQVLFCDGNFRSAVDLLLAAIDDAADDHELLVQTLLLLAHALTNTGQYDECLHRIRQALALADELHSPMLTSP